MYSLSTIELMLLESLLPCEWRVLLCMTDDQSISEIAENLCLSPKTIETYRNRIGVKIGVSGSGKLSRFARQNKESLRLVHNKFYPPRINKINTNKYINYLLKCRVFPVSQNILVY
jgi:DNA-binding CsgD family transcriptional regulator